MSFNFDVYPKVVRRGRETEIRVEGIYPGMRFDPERRYIIRLFSKVDKREEISFEIKPEDEGRLSFAYDFKTPGEYRFDLFVEGAHRPIGTFGLFSLEGELLSLRPFKGDMHIHTFYSDGAESPIYMAVRGKELGLDFIAITDHNKYEPSVEAIREAERIGLDMLLIPGEEVSTRESCGHILSINASGWVAGLMEEIERYDAEVSSIAAELEGRELVKGLTPRKYAHAVWVVRKIRELGGFAVIAHPYWVASRRFDLDRRVYEQLLEDGLYDAVELLGDVASEDNFLSVARFMDELQRGRRPPIIGNSDTHRAHGHTYGRYWTVVFAEELSVEAVLGAIKDHRSVACERPQGQNLRVFGPFELVEYTYFLDRELFPIHDGICALEGKLFMRVLEGKEGAIMGELEALKRELKGFYERYFG